MAELKSPAELENTRKKLRLLEEQYALAQARESNNDQARQLTLRSLKKLINQVTEEIARFEAHTKGPA